MRFKAKPWELVFDLLSKWVVGRDFKAKLEAQGKKIEAQGKELESRLSALEAEIIWRAPTLEEARRIYDGFRAAAQMRQQVKGNGF